MAKRKRQQSSKSKAPKLRKAKPAGEGHQNTAGNNSKSEADSDLSAQNLNAAASPDKPEQTDKLQADVAKTPVRRLGFFSSSLLFTAWLGFLAFVAWKVVNQ